MTVIADAEWLYQAQFYSGAGNWLDRSGNGHHAVPNGAPVFNDTFFTLDGLADFFEIPDDPALDFAADEPLTVMVVARTADVTPASNITLLSKKTTTGGVTAGWIIYLNNTGRVTWRIADGAVTIIDQQPGAADNVRFVGAGVRHIPADDIEAFIDGEGSGSPTADTTTLTLANAEVMRIGATSTGGNLWAGDIFAAAGWRAELSDAHVLQAGQELLEPAPVLQRMRSPRYGITRMARR